MPYGRSAYPTGASTTEVGDVNVNPTNALQALMGQEANWLPRAANQARQQQRTAAAPAAPVRGRWSTPIAGSEAQFRHGGSGRSASDGARALVGRHGFVQNVGGMNTVPGVIETGEGAGAVYGGWRVTEGNPGTRFANAPSSAIGGAVSAYTPPPPVPGMDFAAQNLLANGDGDDVPDWHGTGNRLRQPSPTSYGGRRR